MPQYGPGHGELVAELRAGLPPSLAVAGGYLDGIGVPACVAAATRAAASLVDSARGTIGAMAKLDYDALNSTMRYLMFSVFAVQPGALGDERAAVVDETATFLKQQEDNGVVVRGLYDVAGMRADADFMIWTHAERVEALQATYSDFRRTTTLGRASDAGVEHGRAAPARRVQQEPHPGVPGR